MNKILSPENIERAIKNSKGLHEHPDCIRFAYEWLDAQKRTTQVVNSHNPLKHIIESWSGRYVSQSDVEVAAKLLGLKGSYPAYNLDLTKIVNPDLVRIKHLDEFGKHSSKFGITNCSWFYRMRTETGRRLTPADLSDCVGWG